ncbi:MAG: 16S rRNA (cytidine(1402)-2'-O)-methyltransferase [Candidatus Sabulitectum sp.]|nr:16S rRNA (cytidine(1402)-2'-O)-methyltransferase [Candidatus Sabulitectum sp.]
MNRDCSGKLVLVATPIGNLDDMSPRALEALSAADAVMAEDTRRTGRFVPERKRLYSCHDHNIRGRLPQIEQFLRRGATVAMASDAGTPGISDPAYRAVGLAVELGAEVTMIPGPSAVIMALVVSGLPTDRFAFEGFLPFKQGRRRRRLEAMADYTGTIACYVGPHHLSSVLEAMLSVFGNRRGCVAREMTKLHEEIVRGTLSSLMERYTDSVPKGEITLLVEGASD